MLELLKIKRRFTVTGIIDHGRILFCILCCRKFKCMPNLIPHKSFYTGENHYDCTRRGLKASNVLNPKEQKVFKLRLTIVYNWLSPWLPTFSKMMKEINWKYLFACQYLFLWALFQKYLYGCLIQKLRRGIFPTFWKN